MKTTLGLDIGTNSIGWALTLQNFEENNGNVLALGSRIIPMSQDELSKFDSGQTISKTAERTGYRSARRLNQRHLLRRERLLRVLNILDFLPTHFKNAIDFEKRLGQFRPNQEPKITYRIDELGKSHFLFLASFNEMLADFAIHQPILLADDRKIPFDWTIYYLRKKALTHKISKEELAWLLLNFNQKRGYYQLRGEEEEEKQGELLEFCALRVLDVVDTKEKNKAGQTAYKIILENGWSFIKPSKYPIDWKDKIREFIVVTDVENDGITPKKDKEGNDKRRFRSVDSEKDWIAIKKKTEQDLALSGKTVGEFIYDALLKNPNQKIKGGLIKTIERKNYKDELIKILAAQKQFHEELNDLALYEACLDELYENNEAHRLNSKQKDSTNLLINDIIFYQRPLKSKTSLISDCPFETRRFLKDEKTEFVPLKCIPKSHLLFQEFRLWQFVRNLKVIQREGVVNGKLQNDIDISAQYLANEEVFIQLFDFLNDKKEITQKQFLAYFKLKEDKYRWNMVEDKIYPCNETRHLFLNAAAKIEGFDLTFFENAFQSQQLWHILYSVTDKIEIKKALQKFAVKNQLPEEFAEVFSKLKPFKNDYGAFSEKAIKKLLPLMRMGKYWSENAIHAKTLARIDKILTGEFDEKIRTRVRDKAVNLTQITDFKGLPLWLASYVVYDRHSEASEVNQWKTPQDIEHFLQDFKQHALRNPVVEKIIAETLRVVKDIWQQYGEGNENFFDEIHIELGREMKNPADKRKRITEQITKNEGTNLRIKAILTELKNEGNTDVRPYSPSQQEILKIYEEGVLLGTEAIPDDILKISKLAQPSSSEIRKYRLWLEQNYISPYTGAVIPLSKLFSTAYQIEHIIPQSRYFDDSMANKVICEAEVNAAKGNKTAYEFIMSNGGSLISLNAGKFVKVFSKEAYEAHVKKQFASNKTKRNLLLSEEIPQDFINRQLNDSRYISKVIKNLLSNLVRTENEQEATSKNIVVLNGAITSKMKQDWGLNDVWNELITPRFERLNIKTDSGAFGAWENKNGKRVFQITAPESKGFSKKRIDHRHHALDALVIACTTKDHVNYLNSIESERKNYSLVNKLIDYLPDTKEKRFKKPWATFTQDAREQLLATVVSFKQNTRVINKTQNKTQNKTWHWVRDSHGKTHKVLQTQVSADNWAIRKPMHKETIYGKIDLKVNRGKMLAIAAVLDKPELIIDKQIKALLKEKIALKLGDLDELKKYLKANPLEIEGKKIDKVAVYEWITPTASRKSLDTSFDEKRIESITDEAIRKILLRHLANYQNQTDEKGKPVPAHELAFAEEGLEQLNKNLVELNNGKAHQPIYKVRVFEEGKRFAVGQTGNKKDKFVEAASGTNLFFAIYANPQGERNFKTIALNEVIERFKQGLQAAEETDEKGNRLLFTLSPNDLVYVPTPDEQENLQSIDFEHLSKSQVERIYKMVSSSEKDCFFIRHDIAKPIVDKFEFSPANKMEKDLEGNSIKKICIKLKVDRLGKVSVAKN